MGHETSLAALPSLLPLPLSLSPSPPLSLPLPLPTFPPPFSLMYRRKRTIREEEGASRAVKRTGSFGSKKELVLRRTGSLKREKRSPLFQPPSHLFLPLPLLPLPSVCDWLFNPSASHTSATRKNCSTLAYKIVRKGYCERRNGY